MNNRFEKYFFVIAIIFCIPFFTDAQVDGVWVQHKLKSEKRGPHLDSINNLTHYKKNVIYLEGLGNGWGCSINYERNLGDNKHGFMTFRIGGTFSTEGDGYFFPLLLNQVYDKNKNHHVEVGGGVMLPFGIWREKFFFDTYRFAATANIMYRYQKPNGHFIARVGWTPLINLDPERYTMDYGVGFFVIVGYLWFGGSIGYAF